MTLPQAPYSSHVREEILRRVAAGERLRAICAEAGAPCCESVTGWARREPEGFGAALEAAYAQGAWRRRHGCDPEAARAILRALGEGRRLEDIVRGPGMPSLRTFMAWKADHAWIAEAYGLVMAGREQVRRDAGGEERDAGVDPGEVPPAVDDHGRVRLVALEDAVERLTHRRHLRRVDRALGVGGGEAGGEQELVAVAQRDVELLGQVQDHVAARPGPAGLEEAQVARRHARLARQLELAEAPALAPLSQQVSDRTLGHGRDHARPRASLPLPRR